MDLRGLHLPFGTMAVAINSEPAEVLRYFRWRSEGGRMKDDDQF